LGAEARLVELGWDLPRAPKPIGLYRPVVVSGSHAYLSGHGPLKADGTLITGRVGEDVSLESATDAARLTGLGMLASLRNELQSLDRVVRLVKLLGLVQCTADFHQQPAVINGCSQVFADVFGVEVGIGARSAVGTLALPSNMVVEVEAIFEIR
jgi:enamine deaminase RidA (YjgF/YER057c/UK114 family)